MNTYIDIFHTFPIINSAAMTTGVHISSQTSVFFFFFFQIYSQEWNARLYDSSSFGF